MSASYKNKRNKSNTLVSLSEDNLEMISKIPSIILFNLKGKDDLTHYNKLRKNLDDALNTNQLTNKALEIIEAIINNEQVKNGLDLYMKLPPKCRVGVIHETNKSANQTANLDSDDEDENEVSNERVMCSKTNVLIPYNEYYLITPKNKIISKGYLKSKYYVGRKM